MYQVTGLTCTAAHRTATGSCVLMGPQHRSGTQPHHRGEQTGMPFAGFILSRRHKGYRCLFVTQDPSLPLRSPTHKTHLLAMMPMLRQRPGCARPPLFSHSHPCAARTAESLDCYLSHPPPSTAGPDSGCARPYSCCGCCYCPGSGSSTLPPLVESSA